MSAYLRENERNVREHQRNMRETCEDKCERTSEKHERNESENGEKMRDLQVIVRVDRDPHLFEKNERRIILRENSEGK